jgi:WXG100 family type VII secretion target
MSIVRVNFGAMDAGVQNIRSTHARLQAMFEDLQSNVNQLLPTWDGTSRDAYHSVQQRWNTINQELHQALQQMGQGVHVANTNFRSAESANTSGWA